MTIDTATCPLLLSKELVDVLNEALADQQLQPGNGVALNFRDPSYSAEAGGFHPVEIGVDPSGKVLYITDFAYVGLAPFAELAKEIDFDFQFGLLQHFGHEYPISTGRELFEIWQRNFVSYHRMGVYELTVSVC